ncbi:MAG TPA: inositol monophosphatase family protein [Candidatus Saccharimonadales bacterium]|nr:inositol monophosphatase family protein [Candidatus Saccharimonadales bacterium]
MSNLEVMKDAAVAAGKFMRGAGNQTEHTQKSNAKDFVTVADIKSQDLIRKQLNEAFANTVVLSEEDSEEERKQLYAPNFTGFILDPIDGTYNFKRGMQESAISIGYIENGESVAGVVYDPYKDELYEAELGKGALMNGQPIHVSGQSDLEGAAVAFSNSYDDKAMARTLKRHVAIYEQSGVMPWTSCPGSGILIMAWVACGRIDAYHHNGIKPWDNAAAFIIAKEAGATILDLQGNDAKFTTSTLNIGTPAIVNKLQQIFSSLPAELLS